MHLHNVVFQTINGTFPFGEWYRNILYKLYGQSSRPSGTDSGIFEFVSDLIKTLLLKE